MISTANHCSTTGAKMSRDDSLKPAATHTFPRGTALLPSVWLWLYAVSGFFLKTARRFDIGFDWFSRHFDIEKKPLQSIGLVAGAIVALVYWAVVLVMRVV
jgi:hypothetical protein